jgi:hypothetical protein
LFAVRNSNMYNGMTEWNPKARRQSSNSSPNLGLCVEKLMKTSRSLSITRVLYMDSVRTAL